MSDTILLAHGSGGTLSRELIRDLFRKHFSNPALDILGDSAIVRFPPSSSPLPSGERERRHSFSSPLRGEGQGEGWLALTTDAFVINPLIFPGGDIGKLAVCGTINDLGVAGARPLYLTASFIIEEGTPRELLDRIVASMAATAREAGVAIVAGDSKVVERGKADGLFITTAGVGELFVHKPLMPSRIEPGDAILINGPIADHGMAIMAARESLSVQTKIQSDCAPLAGLAEAIAAAVPDVRFMRDATRGGLAAVLNETAEGQPFGIEIDEAKIAVREGTAAACELLGIDPLHVANEGKLVAVVPGTSATLALATMQAHALGRASALIGRATAEEAGRVVLATSVGTKRLVAMPSGEMLPRIC